MGHIQNLQSKSYRKIIRDVIIYREALYLTSIMFKGTESANDNSLISFLKKNEYLFTILGVFLVLAFIFNSPQLVSLANPQSPSSISHMQLSCSINGSNFQTIPNENFSEAELNCTGDITDDLKNSGSESYSNTSMTFSFICLWMALIIYLIICYNLFLALRDSIINIFHHIVESNSREAIKREITLLFLIPFFYQGAVWFIELMIRIFPDLTSSEVVFILLTVVVIEFIFVMGIAVQLENITEKNKKKGLIVSCALLCLGILLLFFSYSEKSDWVWTIIWGVFGLSIGYFGIRGLIRYIKNRELHEVYDVT